MTTYIFMRRNNETAKSEEIARAIVNGNIVWTGDSESIKQTLSETKHREHLPDGFDKSNRRHWETLPTIYQGSRFWVVEEQT